MRKDALKQRTSKILDVTYDRIEVIVLESKKNKYKIDDTLGRIAGVLADANNSIDGAIDYIVR